MPMARKKTYDVAAEHGPGRQHIADTRQTEFVAQWLEDGVFDHPTQKA